MTTELSTTAIEAILDSLFTNGNKEKADRLLLIKEDYSGAAIVVNADDLGGYSRPAVRDILADALRSLLDQNAELSRQLAEARAENKRYETNLIHCMERVTQLEAASKSEGGPA